MDKILGTINGMDFTIGDSLLELSYLIAALLFVFGLKLLSHPATARRGNLWAASGMGLAMITTLLLHKNSSGGGIPMMNMWVIILFIGIGSALGWIIARKVKMTAMPQLVSLFNASGGAASMLVALLEYPNAIAGDTGSILVTVLGLVIGAIAFSGSVIAWGKLDGRVGDIMKPFMTYLNLFLLVLTIALSVYIIISPNPPTDLMWAIYILTLLSLIYGVMFVMPIGGADMPVVISLLNALTGIAAAMAGFIYGNQAMILGGILVGAAGMILTMLMCKAMNRSLLNVIIGSFGGSAAGAAGDGDKTVKEISLSDAAVLLSYSQKVYIVPGYGLAVAQAQHLCHELDTLLAAKGVEVKYAIHPVAGRMPGHMNVLLAEADVPYDKLVEMDEANNEMPNTDVVIVIGANDVVNPAAEDDPGSPIYGMPIIKVLDAKNVIVMKRSMAAGYAAIPNNLFYHPKNSMLFGDAKASLQKLVTEVKSL
ncbi:MAG: NAD(P)(+) transhydrogenase (Re/Si-specific) subunit beta [Lentimicrobium sp.]|jgi:NAD(P) transhydrogenase subunit beta|nr:NAD(P)(+) transhydrogenase (Re/Si-specific) subunit beta [Lentimicrobium sp.]MDD2526963.1 NAD(P)(+) transhydrogenase (Re/Si-specific) subunit beta [Lentimicrobiaceae bacterium]MDD4597841.1 NAD(P)(+) transhydrogenase (Re/Si-specific) subunit beta [Lentimicrobiaceae bacterium]MDY0024977.1 NAD(P)(+) transhydrogenase (Re/Si-specific) subunit beta [Lentimicrobium sp.]